MKKDLTKGKYEEGWEFKLPGFLFNPLNWLLAILIVIALLLSFVLITRITEKENGTQIIKTQSP